jgi:hypothetical protein
VSFDQDADVPPEYREEFDRARKAAMAQPRTRAEEDPHSARAWAMDPRNRRGVAHMGPILTSRFAPPLLPASQVLRRWRVGAGASVGVGGLVVLLFSLREVQVPGATAVVGIAGGATLLAVGAIALWWTGARGQKWADQGLLNEFE